MIGKPINSFSFCQHTFLLSKMLVQKILNEERVDDLIDEKIRALGFIQDAAQDNNKYAR